QPRCRPPLVSHPVPCASPPPEPPYSASLAVLGPALPYPANAIPDQIDRAAPRMFLNGCCKTPGTLLWCCGRAYPGARPLTLATAERHRPTAYRLMSRAAACTAIACHPMRRLQRRYCTNRTSADAWAPRVLASPRFRCIALWRLCQLVVQRRPPPRLPLQPRQQRGAHLLESYQFLLHQSQLLPSQCLSAIQ